ncbi:WGR domain-containing protein [Nodularia sp. LEGE 04288]|uniref:WGR domain-containing protein n=1 Tax=Nodularia sp. LEGE 04288 TaxID=1828639 RepID=UPI001D115FD6|nr:WGR domain-containing protein [Nodularia sp. LEGE 04288]MCC2692880.1 WGR domain-containing protein [Nodularia sp. LEGE 04288]
METYLVFVDAVRNSNKFWSAKVEDSQLIIEWGRVGYKSQTKVHSLASNQRAIFKYYQLVAEKKAKGYQESQSEIDGSRNFSDIRRAIQLLNIMRPCIAVRNFHEGYIAALNEYLQIVPTPLGMQIDPCRVYRTVEDIDHQKQILNSLLSHTPVTVPQAIEVPKAELQTVSLKSLPKSFWRHS